MCFVFNRGLNKRIMRSLSGCRVCDDNLYQSQAVQPLESRILSKLIELAFPTLGCLDYRDEREIIFVNL